MKMRSVLAVLWIALCCSVTLADDATRSWIHYRDGLNNSFSKFAASQKTKAYTKITYFGGSITVGYGSSKPELCYRELLQKYLRSQFPGATLAENNSAIGGTGSWLGAFRTRNQALYGGAALVIVEFAVNDGGGDPQEITAQMEGIVRQIWQTDSTCDILFVYTLGKDHLASYDKGQLPPTVEVHERVAEHYGIPSVNMAAYAYDKLHKGELTFSQFAIDDVHPTDRGYRLYMDALKPLVDKFRSELAKGTPVRRRTLPKPLSEHPMDKAQCVPVEWAKAAGNWSKGHQSPVTDFMYVNQSNEAGATLSFRFKGSQCGLFDVVGPDTGDYEVSVDKGEWKHQADWDQDGKTYSRASAVPLAQYLDPNVWHDVKVRIADKIPAGSTDRFAKIGFILVDGEVEDPYKALDPLSRLDAVWATIKGPIKMTPPAGRFANIPLTMKRLNEGPGLKMVLLGDSIIGDTSSSKFDLRLMQQFPKCKIDKITSVRGSTGCWYYQNDNHVEEYVLKYKPDLLVIGGISQRGDIEAIRSVIHQVRAKQPCEVLLMTPCFGATPDPHIKNWKYDIDAKADPYRAGLRQLAIDEKCAFIDMTGPWWQFIQDSGADYGYFQRDRVHANERGVQIINQIIMKWFAAE